MCSLISLALKKLSGPKILKQKGASIHALEFTKIDGSTCSLKEYKGKKLLLVNIASQCSFTYQYEGLQALSDKYKDKLVVIGFPCNQFLQQEKGSDEEINTFCKVNYGVDFPLSKKIEVLGESAHPIYKWLSSKQMNGVADSKITWNFQKYLLDEEGCLTGIFYSFTKPNNRTLLMEIEK